MAAIRPIFRAFAACSPHPARLAVRRSIVAIPQQRRRYASLQENVDKVNRATAEMSASNAGTVSDVIKHDHAELKEYYDNILSAKDNDSKVRWQNQFTWELARHSIGEELVVYPAMEEHMGDEGKRLADKDREDHNKVRLT